MGFKFWSSWGSGCKKSKTPSRLDFFEFVLKVDLQISPNLRGLFTKKKQVLIFLGLFISKGISFVKLKWIIFFLFFFKWFLTSNWSGLLEFDFFVSLSLSRPTPYPSLRGPASDLHNKGDSPSFLWIYSTNWQEYQLYYFLCIYPTNWQEYTNINCIISFRYISQIGKKLRLIC